MSERLTRWRTVCKLTDAVGRTFAGTQWGRGVTNPNGVLSGDGGLCSDGFYHAYVTPEIGAFLNPIHAGLNADTLLFWRAEIRGTVEEDGILKLGATEMRTVEQIEPIRPTTNQRVAFAIYIASSSRGEIPPAWERWRDNWLDGTDRTQFAGFGAAEDDWTAGAAGAAAKSAARRVAVGAWDAERDALAADIILDACTFALSELWDGTNGR